MQLIINLLANRCTVAQSLHANISKDEVEHVMSHLANDKSPGWDGLTHELFKKYVIKLKGPFTT